MNCHLLPRAVCQTIFRGSDSAIQVRGAPELRTGENDQDFGLTLNKSAENKTLLTVIANTRKLKTINRTRYSCFFFSSHSKANVPALAFIMSSSLPEECSMSFQNIPHKKFLPMLYHSLLLNLSCSELYYDWIDWKNIMKNNQNIAKISCLVTLSDGGTFVWVLSQESRFGGKRSPEIDYRVKAIINVFGIKEPDLIAFHQLMELLRMYNARCAPGNWFTALHLATFNGNGVAFLKAIVTMRPPKE
jgi:hypothetical protein